MSSSQSVVIYRNIPVITLFTFIFLGGHPAGVQAESVDPAAKQALIEQELNCISDAKKSSKNFDWQDVCYVGDAKKSSDRRLTEEDVDYSGRVDEEEYPLLQNRTSTKENEFVLFGLIEKNADYGPDSYKGRYSLLPNENSKFFSGGSLNANYGLRQDDLVWNIGLEGGPNILSELTWDDVESLQMKGRGDLIFYDHFILDGMFAYGDVYDGTNQDSDYLGDFRTYEFSRSRNDSNGDDVLDYSIGAGYRLYFDLPPKDFFFKKVQLTFLGGYSYHEQNFKMTNGYQVIPATGSFSGLNSTYQTEWDSTWLGVDLKTIREDFTAFLRFEYHWADYYGYGNWNLRTDFAHPKSFEHFADAYGRVLSLGGSYAIHENLALNLTFEFQDWSTEAGIDRTNFADGTTSDVIFNTADWESFATMIGITYYFPNRK